MIRTVVFAAFLQSVLSQRSALSPKEYSHDLPIVPGDECDRNCDLPVSFHCVFNWRVENQQINCTDETFQWCFMDGVTRESTVVVDLDKKGDLAKGIFVCENDLVTVNLVNDLEEGTTIHWHGLPMGPEDPTPWADGVPFITQCPIEPKTQFTHYSFRARPSGSYWYHSHADLQRGEGAYGPLVIRDQKETIEELPSELQDLLDDTVCDLTDHTIIIQEWYENSAEYRFSHDKTVRPLSLLVNYHGRRNSTSSPRIPWSVFSVDPVRCRRYRLRLMSAVSLLCPVQISIEDHNMTVIATDGQYIIPETDVTTVTIANGERYDIIIDTEGKDERSYKIRFGASPHIKTECYGTSSLAYLQYNSSPVDQSVEPDYLESISVPGYHLNPHQKIVLPDDQIPIYVQDLRSAFPMTNKKKADKTFYSYFGKGSQRGAHFNLILFNDTFEQSPLIVHGSSLDSNSICDPIFNQGILCNPDHEPCRCPQIIKVAKDDVVEIFLINPSLGSPRPHPIHLHGHFYNVISVGGLPLGEEGLSTWERGAYVTDWVKQQNIIGNITRNFDHPPRKDTVQTLPNGYTLIRFVADNPGYWAMHCHISFHAHEGQMMVVKVGEEGDWNIPEDFPTC